MIILALDSSHQTQSLCIFDSRRSQILASHEGNNKSSQLIPVLAKLLEKSTLKIQNIDLILINLGPGSFTGIRSSLTITKTLGAELNPKIIGINNFELIRFEKKISSKQKFCINAGKNDYFISLNDNYEDLKMNFFSLENLGLETVEFNQNNSARLMIDYFLSLENPKFINYQALKPYYLREPSINKK